MDLNARLSLRRLVSVVLSMAAVIVLFPVGVEAAGPTLMRLVDGDGTSKVQVDAGKVRVGDGTGPLSVDGTVAVKEPLTVNGTVAVQEPVSVTGQTTAALKPAVLLANGYCGPTATAEHTSLLNTGEVVTAIFFTGYPGNYSNGRLDIFPSNEEAPAPTSALMSLKIYHGADNSGTQQVIYSSDSGFKVTGAQPWKVRCAGVHTGTSTLGSHYAIFGYPAS